mmetsp:Transcript_32180/g.61921  ORF Transcript_32180/g.61921 Transcript_32180/m.61921 type:complete len:229 (+) Transcript_32180:1362-2048(+)
MKTPSEIGPPPSLASVPHTNISSKTWRSPPRTATPPTWRSLDAENSTPRAKSRNTTPNCASVSTCTSSFTSPNPPGPQMLPASKYPVITGCPMEAKITPPMAAHTIITTRSEINCKSCCSSIDPFLGLLITNSLSSASIRRATSSGSLSLLLDMPNALSICEAVSSNEARMDSTSFFFLGLVAFGLTSPFARNASAGTGGGGRAPLKRSCVTRATVSSTPFLSFTVSL